MKLFRHTVGTGDKVGGEQLMTWEMIMTYLYAIKKVTKQNCTVIYKLCNINIWNKRKRDWGDMQQNVKCGHL